VGTGYLCPTKYGNLAARWSRVGALSTWQERLSKDAIEINLLGGIGLAELATLCGLRTSHFAHAFNSSWQSISEADH
jgi:AraC family transcriptional regulator